MDNITPPESNFFEISLSQEGANWVFRLYKVVRWLIMLVIAFSGLLLLNICLRIRLYLRYEPDTWLGIFQMRVFPVVEVVVLIVSLVQNYYFLNFSREAKKSIETQQADLFNNSFKWIFKGVVIAIVMTIIQFISVAVVTYSEVIVALGNSH